MSIAAQPRRHADVARLRRSLARGGRDVVVRESRASALFLVGHRAYKLRKPARIDALGERSPQARANSRGRDVELNAELAPGVVLGVRAVVPTDAGDFYLLSPSDDPGAIDHLVEMRRFDETHTMGALIKRGALTTEQASAAGGRLARFHRTASRRRGGVDYCARVTRNLELLSPMVAEREAVALKRFAAAFLRDAAQVLEARASMGSVVDGHGDLRAEHVVFESGQVLIVDRLDSDVLRVVDVADELGLLLMDLADLTGADALGDAVMAGYTTAGGARPPDALLAFFGAYRAQVRAKDALLRSSQSGDGAHVTARRLLALGRRLTWRARGPLALIVTGAPAAEKSALAEALGSVSGLPVLPSACCDAVAAGGAIRQPIVESRVPAPLQVTIEGFSDDVRLAVETPAPIESQVDEVEAWLDSLLAAGRSNSSP